MIPQPTRPADVRRWLNWRNSAFRPPPRPPGRPGPRPHSSPRAPRAAQKI